MIFPDFEEFIASLNAHRVRYLIVGGYAVGFHARPRATKDIDILIDRSAANARRARAAIIAFIGGEAPNITEARLMNPRTLIVLGVDPIRIDILTSIDGVPSFAAAWKRKVDGPYGEARAHYIALEDLVASKLAASRPQDLAERNDLESDRAQPPIFVMQPNPSDRSLWSERSALQETRSTDPASRAMLPTAWQVPGSAARLRGRMGARAIVAVCASRKRLREPGYVTELSVGCFLKALANLLVNLGAERA